MCRENELGVRKLRFKKTADVAAMAGINRHEHIVENGEGELVAEGVLHQGQIEAEAHAILMALAVIRAGREKATPVEINVKAELGRCRLEPAHKLIFVLAVDHEVIIGEVLGNFVIDVF